MIANDDVIDGRYLEVHQAILTLLATQAPVATDLRLISALLHVMKAIERMGDQCVNIAKLIPIAGHEPPADERIVKDVVTMGKQVRTQLAQAKRAFADRDVEMARDLVRQDDVVDNLNKEIFRIALEIGDDHDRREWAMTMILVARAIERIGDNAVDIGEQVAFVVTGPVPRVPGRLAPGRARVPPERRAAGAAAAEPPSAPTRSRRTVSASSLGARAKRRVDLEQQRALGGPRARRRAAPTAACRGRAAGGGRAAAGRRRARRRSRGRRAPRLSCR